MNNILQLKVTLKNTNPAVFRTVQVPSDYTFYDLHYVLQIVMLWENSHLHEFRFKDYRISELVDDGDDEWTEGIIDSKEVIIGDTVSSGDKFEYEYDLGDSWIHEIKVEKEFPAVEGVFYPRLIDGARQSPPEDCGGIPGFMNLLNIMKDEKSDEYEDMVEWLGEPFDPTVFDMQELNEMLEDVFIQMKKNNKKPKKKK